MIGFAPLRIGGLQAFSNLFLDEQQETINFTPLYQFPRTWTPPPINMFSGIIYNKESGDIEKPSWDKKLVIYSWNWNATLIPVLRDWSNYHNFIFNEGWREKWEIMSWRTSIRSNLSIIGSSWELIIFHLLLFDWVHPIAFCSQLNVPLSSYAIRLPRKGSGKMSSWNTNHQTTDVNNFWTPSGCRRGGGGKCTEERGTRVVNKNLNSFPL